MRRWIVLLGLAIWAGTAMASPLVHMLVPGFTVEELPITLPNLNNLRFAPDGTLFALGYNGKVYALSDTNRDGIEDKAVEFWGQSTLSVPVGMALASEGVYVSSRGKVSLLRDVDRDGRADEETVIASGWPATDVASGGVDATAVTLDGDGNLYFGLLTADYSNPYRVKDGKSRYELNGQRGTIQKWSRATKKLETIATGIRVPYALNFNRHGDLFLTDQEGETWCPDGNPLDELNHIIPGRNYGFPPRHPEYLPDLVSEPPVVGFGPQHQSTCGFVFNEPKPNQPRFGPKWWEGDAFVAGESRGKIWRVRLVKTPYGYVGKETLIARLHMLTTDVTISPRGELYVSCHSGLPDWGTGPTGEGKIFRIRYTDPDAPQPVAGFLTDPAEARILFDRAVSPDIAKGAAGSEIEMGEFVRAGDRFEVLKPPYKVVKQQDATPRGKLKILSARVDGDRTLVLTTEPHRFLTKYAVTISNVKGPGASTGATIDVDYDWHGVQLHGVTKWAPHADQRIAEGAKLSFRLKPPPDAQTIHVAAAGPFEISGPANKKSRMPAGKAEFPAAEVLMEFDKPPKITYRRAGDAHERALLLSSFLHPAAPTNLFASSLPAEDKRQFVGGDPKGGKELFFSEQLKCGTCHRVRGEGGATGPDLSNLAHRDAASVLRDITDPHATINPDYVAYNISLNNEHEIIGFIKSQSGRRVRVVDAAGTEVALVPTEVREMRPSPLSLMPSGLLDGLNEAQVRNLVAFLVTAVPEPPKEEKPTPPKRSRTELQALLKSQLNTNALKPIEIVLVATVKDHGPGEHDYPAWLTNWTRLMGGAERVTVSQAWKWPSPEQFKTANVLVFYYWNHSWTPPRYAELDQFLARGGGMAILHSSCIADSEPEPLAERIGLSAQPKRSKYRHGELVLRMDGQHPITKGLPPTLKFLDETYWPMIGDTNKVTVLASAEEEGAWWPMLWTFEKGQGRVFGSILGHYSTTFEDPYFRLMVLRGIAWAGQQPIERFEKLATVGVSFAE